MARRKEKAEESLKPKPEDVQSALAILSSIVQSFNMQAGFILPQLKQLGCDMKPAVYYPNKGNGIYLGYKLILPSEQHAKYLAKCFEEASKILSKK